MEEADGATGAAAVRRSVPDDAWVGSGVDSTQILPLRPGLVTAPGSGQVLGLTAGAGYALAVMSTGPTGPPAHGSVP
jgi:hypothetical protein